ncbi:MAG: hypothetical protein U5J62_06965 [Desulfurivibrio sp.]|nr:hypothetical protein [Desulfurivibrio sp.]
MRPSSQPQEIQDVMAGEIKQEIAGRYFGFRKMIEDDTSDYFEQVRRHSFVLEKRLSFDLIRIYLLLRQEELIQRFLQLSGLNERLFFDTYLLESASIQERVFECQRFKGWTRRGRFVRYFLSCYDNLAFHVKAYDAKLNELTQFQSSIADEIEAFYRQNNVNAIMSFLRSLGDEQATGAMQGGMEVGLADGIEQKLKIKPPAPVEQLLPMIKPLPPLAEVKPALKKMAKEAYQRQVPQLLQLFEANSTPCPERES